MNHDLVGKAHVFPDGNYIEVIQIKERDENQLYVTYMIHDGPGIPRKLVMSMVEFVGHYGHLFGIENEEDQS